MNFLVCFMLIFFVILISLILFVCFFLMDEPSIRVLYRTVWRDIKGGVLYLRIYFFMQYCRFRNLTVVYFFNQNVKKHPNKVCFLFEDEEWTYKQVDELSNKIANFFEKKGYQKGDTIALLMENCPDYICFYLGLGKIGIITALINTKLKTESLAHCINSVNMKGLIFGSDFIETLENAIPYMQESNTANFYYYSRTPEKLTEPCPYKNLNLRLENVSALPLAASRVKLEFRDKLLYIFTSGTTGLPKAAIVTHRRFLHCSRSTDVLTSSTEPRIFYNTLPLYHMAGNVFYVGTVIIFGATMVIKKKFSASNFWKDAVKYNVTICVYIGEICRYLLNQPKVAEESQHSVQVMLGNGLKSHVWSELQQRFRIKRIIEGYGATEGNILNANYFGIVGAAGLLSRICPIFQGEYIIKIRPDTGDIMRDSNGLCIRCKPGELGRLVGRVSSSHPLKQFDGYINTTETSRKIIRNCFKIGDMYFDSGDMFIMDEDGALYFQDRLGDTFRWKGENVSSTEVENILSKVLNFAPCIVYGVEIPGNEGKVGMAAIHLGYFNEIDFNKFYEDIVSRLPTYAIPAFLRIAESLEETGTYKLKKRKFQEQGYNPEDIDDPLYVLDAKNKTYVTLTNEVYNDIIKGSIRF